MGRHYPSQPCTSDLGFGIKVPAGTFLVVRRGMYWGVAKLGQLNMSA